MGKEAGKIVYPMGNYDWPELSGSDIKESEYEPDWDNGNGGRTLVQVVQKPDGNTSVDGGGNPFHFLDGSNQVTTDENLLIYGVQERNGRDQ